jgi:hypothetical protein
MWQRIEYFIALLLHGDKTKSDIEYKKLIVLFPEEESVINLQRKSKYEILEIHLH